MTAADVWEEKPSKVLVTEEDNGNSQLSISVHGM
jgi:hypothetical protein